MNDDLIAFIQDLRNWLCGIVHAPASHLAGDPKLDEYRAAWGEIQVSFDELIGQLRNMPESWKPSHK